MRRGREWGPKPSSVEFGAMPGPVPVPLRLLPAVPAALAGALPGSPEAAAPARARPPDPARYPEDRRDPAGAGGEFVGDAISDRVPAVDREGGAESPVGFGIGRPRLGGGAPANPGCPEALAIRRPTGSLFPAIAAAPGTRGGGADLRPLCADGVPGIGFRTVGEHCFDRRHPAADTRDPMDPGPFRRAVGRLAGRGQVLADRSGDLPRGGRPPGPMTTVP